MLDSALTRRLVFECRPRLALAALGDEAGCIGAAMLAARRCPGRYLHKVLDMGILVREDALIFARSCMKGA